MEDHTSQQGRRLQEQDSTLLWLWCQLVGCPIVFYSIATVASCEAKIFWHGRSKKRRAVNKLANFPSRLEKDFAKISLMLTIAGRPVTTKINLEMSFGSYFRLTFYNNSRHSNFELRMYGSVVVVNK